MDFAVLTDHRIKLKENEKRDKFLDFAREIKKNLWNMKETVIPIMIISLGTVTKGLIQGVEGLEINRRVERNPNYSIIEIGKNTAETWGYLLWGIIG